MQKILFLLGGHDLEMLEIRNIFDKLNIQYKDKKLRWGAKVSDYKEYLNFEGTIYGIELEEDIGTPKNYKAIDHHNGNFYMPSALEQVTNILNIELSREQQLIAANDSRYIAGMKNICATQEEIKYIRSLDRKAQGVTSQDEKLAQQSFDTSKKINTNCIFSQTVKFSAVSDLAYAQYEKYVIYNFSKIVFYGYKTDNVLKFLASEKIDKKRCYYGGGDYGFVGIKEGVLSFQKIYKLIKEFQRVQAQEEIYSYHTFMLPFTFKGKFDSKQNWEYKNFELQEQRDFNEFVYFYKHVQDAIFNTHNENENSISKYYEYEKQKGHYTINCKKGEFTLALDGISLRIFNTNVAILALNLKNTKYPELESVLAINDFGRRIYPQFLGQHYTKDTKQAILANSIVLSLDGKEPIIENFEYFDNAQNLKNLKEIKLLPSFITKLIEKNFIMSDVRPIIDDRMFVLSQYHNDALIEQLKVYKECGEYEYETNDFWYQYLFVDGDDKTCQSRHMSKKLISDSTYDRWIEWGTLFGISRYSFVALTGSWFGKNRLLPHMQTMYFQMFTLLLAYRATIIKFSDDIQNATDETTDKKKAITQETQNIYKNYLNFLNKLFFKEVTAQDQGIELYNKAMKIMEIDKYINDLDNEINELYSYVKLLEEEERTKSMDKISKLGSYLLLPALITSFLGMNIIDFSKIVKDHPWCYGIGAVLLTIGSGFLMPFILNKLQKENHE